MSNTRVDFGRDKTGDATRRRQHADDQQRAAAAAQRKTPGLGAELRSANRRHRDADPLLGGHGSFAELAAADPKDALATTMALMGHLKYKPDQKEELRPRIKEQWRLIASHALDQAYEQDPPTDHDRATSKDLDSQERCTVRVEIKPLVAPS